MFNYLLAKIQDAKIQTEPFPHLQLENFLSPEHLSFLLHNDQLHFQPVESLNELQHALTERRYQVQAFPACVTSWSEYHQEVDQQFPVVTNGGLMPAHTRGLTLRLQQPRDAFLRSLLQFLNGTPFHQALKKKFAILQPTTIISAVQKNLPGYEITPHPDSRRKALTYLLNINRDSSIQEHPVHTHLLKFRPAAAWIPQFWRNNPNVERGWVPWEVTQSIKQIQTNNTLIIFQPHNQSLHAIKLDPATYQGLEWQRTQIYGNLMFKFPPSVTQVPWQTLLARHEEAEEAVESDTKEDEEGEGPPISIPNRSRVSGVQ